MKILVCQTSPKVNALKTNYREVQQHYQKALEDKIDICVFPELCISGYLAEDLFLCPDFISEVEHFNQLLVTESKSTYLLLPSLIKEDEKLYNGVIIAQNGKIIGKSYKADLPNYGIFDEYRYFTPGEPKMIEINGVKIGIPVCEDVWHPDICKELKKQGAELLIVPNASPYEKGKLRKRLLTVKERFQEVGLPLIYCNQALAHDGIIFDGRSFIYDGKSEDGPQNIGKAFAPNSAIVYYSNQNLSSDAKYHELNDVCEEMLEATILGIKDYVHDNGFKKVVLGLSGGIDSALVALLATKALGSENVYCYMLQSKFTSKASIKDAEELAETLKIHLESINIQNMVDQFVNEIGTKHTIKENSITYQNIQSRVRGSILMTISNEIGALLLTTGNKSEYATGYATIYGDMNGAFNPIKDLYKTNVYAFAKCINRKDKLIPQNIIEKSPSAELAHDQRDSDSLPPYDILDNILEDIIENNMSRVDLYKQFDSKIVDRVFKLLSASEFKRFQSAPGIKLSSRHFDRDWRFPITGNYRN